MSVDNWSICPRCLLKGKAVHEVLEAQVREAYGVLPPDEYEELRAASLVPLDEEEYRTFREDYEMWMDSDGKFTVVYGGECIINRRTGCGFKHQFNHSETVPV